MTTRDVPWSLAPPAPSTWRKVVAAALQLVGAALAVLAHRLGEEAAAVEADDPVLEFYAEAGAPEGALYVDGRLVGKVHGVTRL